jgi:hypothetical protein
VITGHEQLLTSNVARKPVLQCLLRNIRLFGDGQFRYFKDKLDRKLDDDVANGYSHEYGLARTLTQISYDLNAISQAVLVRLFLSQQIVFTLERADEFAIAMLEPANTAGLFDIPNPPNPAQQVRITAVTYFRQSMRVRVVPYAPVALVGIPYSCLTPNTPNSGQRYFPERDFLPIPHEVGHHVYTHGKYVAGTDVGKSFFHAYQKHLRNENLPSWVRYWAEEIFADVYGCRIGGPLMALSAQDLALDANPRHEFLNDDGQHPCPYLRPDIYLWTLEAMKLQAHADALRERWQDKRNKFALPFVNDPDLTPEGDPTGIQLAYRNGGSDAPQVLREQLQRVVTIVNDILSNIQYVPSRLANLIANAKDNPLVNTDGSLDDISTVPVGIDDSSFNCANLDYADWQTKLIKESQETWGWGNASPQKSKKIEWGVVLRARGWDDEGPQSNPPPI